MFWSLISYAAVIVAAAIATWLLERRARRGCLTMEADRAMRSLGKVAARRVHTRDLQLPVSFVHANSDLTPVLGIHGGNGESVNLPQCHDLDRRAETHPGSGYHVSKRRPGKA